MAYLPVIGMEVHVELKTETKMFCPCKNGLGLETVANSDVCAVCTGQPGTLPVPNRKAIEFVQMVGLALGGTLRTRSKFDRKNYFYPDLPKGYQISQYDQPLVEKGLLDVDGVNIRITRIHMEEDTGKSLHPKNTNYTLVDFNRAGVPLMELVTEPDIESGIQARKFCQKLQQILRYLGVSDADMEKGQMRCEANISLYKEGQERLSGTKVEVKNLNSFKVVEKAIVYELKRQEEILSSGGAIIQETRGWDENRNETVSQRIKESAHDYRYFPEPDIPPMDFDLEYIERIKRSLPELPTARQKRFQEEYGLIAVDAEQMTLDKSEADYFENIVSEIKEKIVSHEIASTTDRTIKVAVNYFMTEIRKYFSLDGSTVNVIKITPENFAEFAGIVADQTINSSAAQIVLKEMYHTGADPSHVIDEKNLRQMNDDVALQEIVTKVIDVNAKSVEDYRSGKTNALQFLVGQVMKEAKGRANPSVVLEMLRDRLTASVTE